MVNMAGQLVSDRRNIQRNGTGHNQQPAILIHPQIMHHSSHQAQHTACFLKTLNSRPILIQAIKNLRMDGIAGAHALIVVNIFGDGWEIGIVFLIELAKGKAHLIACRIIFTVQEQAATDNLKTFVGRNRLPYGFHEQLKIFFFAIVWCGGQQQKMPCDSGKKSAQLIALGVFHFTAPISSGKFMRFVAYDQVPIAGLQLILHFRATGKFIQSGDAEVHLRKYITRNGRFKPVVRQDFKAQMEFLKKLILPLLAQVTGCDDQAAFQIAADD